MNSEDLTEFGFMFCFLICKKIINNAHEFQWHALPSFQNHFSIEVYPELVYEFESKIVLIIIRNTKQEFTLYGRINCSHWYIERDK